MAGSAPHGLLMVSATVRLQVGTIVHLAGANEVLVCTTETPTATTMRGQAEPAYETPQVHRVPGRAKFDVACLADCKAVRISAFGPGTIASAIISALQAGRRA